MQKTYIYSRIKILMAVNMNITLCCNTVYHGKYISTYQRNVCLFHEDRDIRLLKKSTDFSRPHGVTRWKIILRGHCREILQAYNTHVFGIWKNV
jgi:hypothetical protein